MNAPALRKLADHIRKNPDKYDQGTFGDGRGISCDSPACIAGHQAILSLKPDERFFAGEIFSRRDTWASIEDGDVDCITSAYDRAQDTLGLTDRQASTLFDGSGCYWPAPWSTAWSESFNFQTSGPMMRAAIASDLLDALANGRATLPDGY